MQTVFAVPAFKFDNQWLDGLFRPVNDSDASTSADGSSPSDTLKPVFSGYGVVYILISAFMTGITLGAYFSAKRRRDEDEHVYDDEQVGFAKREQAETPWLPPLPLARGRMVRATTLEAPVTPEKPSRSHRQDQ